MIVFSNVHINTNQRRRWREFFSPDTFQYPASLSKCGEMCCSDKSDLVNHIEPSVESTNDAPGGTAAALERSVFVNMTKPKKN